MYLSSNMCPIAHVTMMSFPDQCVASFLLMLSILAISSATLGFSARTTMLMFSMRLSTVLEGSPDLKLNR